MGHSSSVEIYEDASSVSSWLSDSIRTTCTQSCLRHNKTGKEERKRRDDTFQSYSYRYYQQEKVQKFLTAMSFSDFRWLNSRKLLWELFKSGLTKRL